jgi:hypothetical protein
MMRFTYPAENSQGKWNETIDLGNSKVGNQIKNTRLKDSNDTLRKINNILPILEEQQIQALSLFVNELCMHVLFDLTTKTIAKYLRTYVVSFSGIRHTSLTNN